MMKKQILLFLALVLACHFSDAQTLSNTPSALAKPNTWKDSQLIQPSDLVLLIKDQNAKKPLIFNIGAVDDIEGAKNFGASHETANLEKFKKELETLPKNTFLIVYCGCCPFERCPNIRPAFSLLNEMGFVNARLLNIPKNLKTDWIEKGYPLAEKKAPQ